MVSWRRSGGPSPWVRRLSLEKRQIRLYTGTVRTSNSGAIGGSGTKSGGPDDD